MVCHGSAIVEAMSNNVDQYPGPPSVWDSRTYGSPAQAGDVQGSDGYSYPVTDLNPLIQRIEALESRLSALEHSS